MSALACIELRDLQRKHPVRQGTSSLGVRLSLDAPALQALRAGPCVVTLRPMSTAPFTQTPATP